MLTVQDWPVAFRLLAVIVLALLMGQVFGGLRVAAAVDSAAGFGRVTQLATLGQQVTRLVQALEDERDETAGVIPAATPQAAAQAVQRWYSAVLAVREANTELVSYEMTLLVEAVGEVLTPAARAQPGV